MTQAIMTRSAPDVLSFIAKWRTSGGAEIANTQMFLSELCDVLGVPRPDPTGEDEAENTYVFEKAVTFRHGDGTTSSGRIDLYKRGCFVLESKQGSGGDSAPAAPSVPLTAPQRRRVGTAVRGSKSWSQAMERAHNQAAQYAKALSEWPPFLVVIDVGHAFALFANFARDGKGYLPFPDPKSHRFLLDDLADEAVRDRLKRLWTDPLSLDPSRVSAKVTTEIAELLAALAAALEKQGHAPNAVADFLMRCLFTMFAEDVGLLPEDGFTNLLTDLRGKPGALASMMQVLWQDMDRGGFSAVLKDVVLRFNGRFFHDASVIQLDGPQVDLLLAASKADWSQVEPAIFGTLLERALDPTERHALGAHFTPRAYVERLVFPTVIEPLREEWQTVKAAAMTLLANETGNERTRRERHEKAIETIRTFRRQLCGIRVLDPACGTGNFLYITLEHMKRLEGEVLETLADLGAGQEALELAGATVDPHQFLGIEKNPRAASIAELVLWIGYLQWHYRQHGRVSPAEPILRDFRNIEHRDAVLAFDSEELVLDEHGRPVTRWDGETMKKHPVTGKDVPDETATRVLYRYVNARRAEWPEADFIVGNPPYIGNKRMRAALGDGYVDALRAAHPRLPETIDLVMYWWDMAAELVKVGKVRRFGFVTTNSITQVFNRSIPTRHLDVGRLHFAIADHPWVDSRDGAAVRISMTVFAAGRLPGVLATITSEASGQDGEVSVTLRNVQGYIHPDLTTGASVSDAHPLKANRGLCWQGVKLVGDGFLVEAAKLDGLSDPGHSIVKPYISNKDLVQRNRGLHVIDFNSMSEAAARSANPAAYQVVYDTVRPLRLENRDAQRKRNWWLFGRSNQRMRTAIHGLKRFIVTPEVAKHRPFAFIAAPTIPDASLYVVGSDDALLLGVLSSRVHHLWSLAAGGTLEDRPRYQNGPCFDPFAFPAPTDAQAARIRDLAEQLDAHRKARQAAHPDLTLTNTYNVLAKLRAGEALTAKDKKVHEQALTSVLLKLHDDLDAAVFEAYGWPATLTDEEILERLVALNAERAEEERRGLVRWLCPDFQARNEPAAAEVEDDDTAADGDAPVTAASPAPTATTSAELPAWPSGLVDRVRAVREALLAQPGPVTPEALARTFKGGQTASVTEILETLESLGQARLAAKGLYAA